MTALTSAAVEARPERDGDALLAALSGWAADHRAAEAVAGRARERWLRQQAQEAATWLGVLVDLAERRAAVVLELAAGGVARGTLVGVGTDVCLLAADPPRSAATLVALAHVVAARAAGAAPGVAAGDRRPALPLRLADALAALAAEREVARLGLAGGREVTGCLLAAGADVLTVRPGGPPDDHRPGAERIFVPVGSVVTCTPLR